MIELTAHLISVAPGRIAQMAVDGRGVLRVPLSVEQERAMAGRENHTFKITIEDTEKAEEK